MHWFLHWLGIFKPTIHLLCSESVDEWLNLVFPFSVQFLSYLQTFTLHLTIALLCRWTVTCNMSIFLRRQEAAFSECSWPTVARTCVLPFSHDVTWIKVINPCELKCFILSPSFMTPLHKHREKWKRRRVLRLVRQLKSSVFTLNVLWKPASVISQRLSVREWPPLCYTTEQQSCESCKLCCM